MITIRGKKYRVSKISQSGVFTELPGELVGGKILTDGFPSSLKIYDARTRDGIQPLLEISCREGRQENEEIFPSVKRYDGGLAAVLEGENAEGYIYHEPFDIASEIHAIKELLEGEFVPQWEHELKFNLDTAKTDYLIEEFPTKANYLYIKECTGLVIVKFNHPTGLSWTLSQNTKIKIPFEKIYLTWTAQSGKNIRFYVSNQDIEEEESASTPTIYNVTMTLANTEYSQVAPANTKKITIQTRDGTAFRLAFETGKVATPTAPYYSIKVGDVYYDDQIHIGAITIYFACSIAGKVIEMIAWR